MAQPGQFSVGQLYNSGRVNGLPVWSQPDGIGGLVYPQMPQTLSGQPAVYPSLYAWGCGHRTNTAEIFTVFDPYSNQQVALVTCSMCSFIQQIIEPAENYWNYLDTPLVIA